MRLSEKISLFRKKNRSPEIFLPHLFYASFCPPLFRKSEKKKEPSLLPQKIQKTAPPLSTACAPARRYNRRKRRKERERIKSYG